MFNVPIRVYDRVETHAVYPGRYPPNTPLTHHTVYTLRSTPPPSMSKVGWSDLSTPLHRIILSNLDVRTRGRLHRTNRAFATLRHDSLSYPIHIDLRGLRLPGSSALVPLLTDRTRALWWDGAVFQPRGMRLEITRIRTAGCLLTGLVFLECHDNRLSSTLYHLIKNSLSTLQHLVLSGITQPPNWDFSTWQAPAPAVHVHTLELSNVHPGWTRLDLAASFPNVHHVILGAATQPSAEGRTIRWPSTIQQLTFTTRNVTMWRSATRDLQHWPSLQRVEYRAGLDRLGDILPRTTWGLARASGLTVTIHASASEAEALTQHPPALLEYKTMTVSAKGNASTDRIVLLEETVMNDPDLD